MSAGSETRPSWTAARWPVLAGLIALVLTAAAALLIIHGPAFAYHRRLAEIPAIPLAAGLVVASLVWLLLLPVISAATAAPARAQSRFLLAILAFGLALRLAMFATPPALEDDWHRYLWDGAVTASGSSPYTYAPSVATAPGAPKHLADLAREADAAGRIHARINHPTLRTIYPPVAQGTFALAHLIAPFRLEAWRAICLVGEIVTAGLLIGLLRATGRSPLWVALYWWNPVIVKELVGSAHMEAILLPPLIGAVWAASAGRHLIAALLLGLAAGAKIWPLILAPILFRPLLLSPRRLGLALALLAGLSGLWAWPILASGLDRTSGFVAYATYWQTNSALFPALTSIIGHIRELSAALGLAAGDAPGATLADGRMARALLAAVLLGFVAWLSWRPIADPADLASRVALATSALLILSPAQFPWYLAWTLPFLAVRPIAGMLAAAALIPIYYASFHFIAAGSYGVFRNSVVWLIWLPVWALLAAEAIRGIGRPRPPDTPAPLASFNRL